jgi:hypothetical protein
MVQRMVRKQKSGEVFPGSHIRYQQTHKELSQEEFIGSRVGDEAEGRGLSHLPLPRCIRFDK